jgi:hypothetical protein
MKCWLKVAAVVSFLALLGADIGLQTAHVFGGASLPISTPSAPALDAAKTTDIVQAASAAIVAGFTLGLVIVGYRQTRILREQKDISKRQAAIAERLQAPVMSVKIDVAGIELRSQGPQFYHPREVAYWFVNHGQAPAFLLAVEEAFHAIKPGGGLPPPISPNDPDIRRMAYGVIVPPGGRSDTMKRNLFSLLFTQTQDAFYTTKIKLFLTIFARFEDLFGERWIRGLCYIFDDLSNDWVLAGGTEKHNYCRREF